MHIPAFLAARLPHTGGATPTGFDLHRSAGDTLDKVVPAELAQNVAVWTSFPYTVADSDIDFRKLATEAK